MLEPARRRRGSPRRRRRRLLQHRLGHHAVPGVMALLLPSLLGLLLMLLSGTAQGSYQQETLLPSSAAELKPFRVLGAWLDGSEESNLRGAGAGSIERAFKVVASSQAALKTMDGAAHGLYAYSKAGAPMATRAWTRLEYSRATRGEKEARLKAFRKAKLLEEAVYSAELAELTAEGVGREEALDYVGQLQARHEVLLEDFASVQGGRFRFLLLADTAGRRLTLSVGDAIGDWEEKLDTVRVPPLSVPLRSRGLLRRAMSVNPRLWAAAVVVAGRVKPVLLRALKETHQGCDVHLVGFSLGAGVAAMVGGMLDGAIVPALPPPPPPLPRTAEAEEGAGETGAEGPAAAAAAATTGGGAGAAAMVARRRRAAARDGRRGKRREKEGAGDGEGLPSVADMQALHGVIGMARDNVTTFVFAPPPCISKGVRGLHRFTTSFVMGDDMVPRANAASLERLEKRLLDYVSEGGGGGGGIYLDYARSWVKGVVGATLQQVVTHQVGGKDGDPEAEDGEGEDETELTLPGRVYYIKPRKLHGGATIKEVLRGSLREDVLWKMHDILVSKSMLKHHSLDKYVGVLARVPIQ